MRQSQPLQNYLQHSQKETEPKPVRHWRTEVKMIYPILIDKFVHKIVMGRVRLNCVFIQLNGKCGVRTSLVGKDLFKYRFE